MLGDQYTQKQYTNIQNQRQGGMQQDYEMFKIVVIGSMGTGKTNISTRYIRNQYNEAQKSTVGVEFLSKIVQVRNQSIKVTLWDTAGQERYKSLSKVYYKGASGILIVYDVTDPQSYLDVESWMRLANQNLNLNEVVMMVVGNKVDMESDRKVPTERPQKQYKDKFDVDCWEVSAKTGYNVREIFTELLERIYQKNIEIKSSAFQDPSDWGGSVIADSIIAGGQNKKPPAARTSMIPEVIIQEKEDEKITSANLKKPVKPANNVKQEQQVISKPKKQDRMTLNAKDDKKRGTANKEKKGCC